jgi:D-sedoheptulose 7-phosphate isomerase
MYEEFIKEYTLNSLKTKEIILKDEVLIGQIEEVSNLIIDAYLKFKKVLIAGNGGSAADAQHIACEFVSKFKNDRKPLNAIALTTNTSVLTSISNDYDFSEVFSRQINGNGIEGDIFIAISTSGKSKNIIRAMEEAKKKNIKTVLLTGSTPCLGDKVADISLKIPSNDTPIIQESHIMIGHMIAAIVEQSLGDINE